MTRHYLTGPRTRRDQIKRRLYWTENAILAGYIALALLAASPVLLAAAARDQLAMEQCLKTHSADTCAHTINR